MVNPAPTAPPTAAIASQPWYRQLNSYHWLVLIVCTVAWAFDCLSQQIFNLTRKPAMDESPNQAGTFSPKYLRLADRWATAELSSASLATVSAERKR